MLLIPAFSGLFSPEKEEKKRRKGNWQLLPCATCVVAQYTSADCLSIKYLCSLFANSRVYVCKCVAVWIVIGCGYLAGSWHRRPGTKLPVVELASYNRATPTCIFLQEICQLQAGLTWKKKKKMLAVLYTCFMV